MTQMDWPLINYSTYGTYLGALFANEALILLAEEVNPFFVKLALFGNKGVRSGRERRGLGLRNDVLDLMILEGAILEVMHPATIIRKKCEHSTWVESNNWMYVHGCAHFCVNYLWTQELQRSLRQVLQFRLAGWSWHSKHIRSVMANG